MNLTEIITTDEAREGFYPTPQAVAEKLLEGVDWLRQCTVLEPSAGKGDLVEAILRHYKLHGWANGNIEIDCIEIDPHLRSVLEYEHCGPRLDAVRKRIRELENKRYYDHARGTSMGGLTASEVAEFRELTNRKEWMERGTVRTVHDDFQTFESRKHYNLIVMNPPFADGDLHLLRAIEMQRRLGGEIRCILNAETLHNTYTNRRKLLRQTLEDLGAEIQFVDGAFSTAERKTDVSVALIGVKIPTPQHKSEIYERLKKAAEIENPVVDDVTDLTVADFMGRIVSQFNVEVEAGLSLIREFHAMTPYILRNMDPNAKYNSPTLSVVVNDGRSSNCIDYPNPNKFLRLTRKKYWEALFTNKEFVGQLTSNLRDKYESMVEKMQDYDFTLFNIQRIMTEMNAEMVQGVQETIVALFDKLTTTHSWYPECEKNIHYFNGWATNKAHKIGGKVILPIYGVFSSYGWDKETFNVREAEKIISDIEKVFEYLDGNATASVDLHGVLLAACKAGQTKNIQCKFFSVTLYKKGTMHIKFHDQRLVDRFNVYCCSKKNWLPPNYGRTVYADMSREEREIVDGFNGNGTEGSGATAYAAIMARPEYFLAEPGNQIRAIPGA